MSFTSPFAAALLVVALLGCCFPSLTVGQSLSAPFDRRYVVSKLRVPTHIKANIGGLCFLDAETLLVVSRSDTHEGKLMRVPVVRHPLSSRIVNLGEATLFHPAHYADSSVGFFPQSSVLFYTQWPNDGLRQLQTSSRPMPHHTTPLYDLGVVDSLGGAAFVPPNWPEANRMKLFSYANSSVYDVSYRYNDVSGLFHLTSATRKEDLSGGLGGAAYVAVGSPHFDAHSMIVAEYDAGVYSAYKVDGNGDPIASTRRPFLTDVPFAVGVVFDPVTGDMLFTSNGFESMEDEHYIGLVRGFRRQEPAD